MKLCNIDSRKTVRGKRVYRLEDEDGNFIKPNTLKDFSGNVYKVHREPEYGEYCELRTSSSDGFFKDVLVIVE